MSDENKMTEEEWRGTIPSSLRPGSMADFGYHFNKEGKMVHIKTGKPFHFISQHHYDALGDTVLSDIQKKLVDEFKYEEVRFPLAAKGDEPTIPIYSSPGALEAETLLVLLQGSGPVRPGVWARALCMNDDLSLGTMFPYMREAEKRGWGVVILNPNENSTHVHSEASKKKEESIDPLKWFLSQDKRPLNKVLEMEEVAVRGNERPRTHTVYAWDELVSKSKAKNLLLVAHSAGGSCTVSLLEERPEVMDRLRAVAFTDSVHRAPPSAPKPLREFIQSRCKNWVTSEKPLGTPVSMSVDFKLPSSMSGCPCVSAGHKKHAFTSGTSIESVFKFLDDAAKSAASSV